jgi:hypothetical protein
LQLQLGANIAELPCFCAMFLCHVFAQLLSKIDAPNSISLHNPQLKNLSAKTLSKALASLTTGICHPQTFQAKCLFFSCEFELATHNSQLLRESSRLGEIWSIDRNLI